MEMDLIEGLLIKDLKSWIITSFFIEDQQFEMPYTSNTYNNLRVAAK